MKQRIMEWFRSDSRAAWGLLILGILGMVLIALGGTSFGEQAEFTSQSQPGSWSQYQQELEQRLEQLLGEIQGVGKVSVMVTLESGEETEYAVDTRESDQSLEQDHVLLKGEEPLVETVWYPQVQGVAVVCQGAQDIQVCAQITQLVSVLTGATTNRISIAKMCE